MKTVYKQKLDQFFKSLSSLWEYSWVDWSPTKSNHIRLSRINSAMPRVEFLWIFWIMVVPNEINSKSIFNGKCDPMLWRRSLFFLFSKSNQLGYCYMTIYQVCTQTRSPLHCCSARVSLWMGLGQNLDTLDSPLFCRISNWMWPPTGQEKKYEPFDILVCCFQTTD